MSLVGCVRADSENFQLDVLVRPVIALDDNVALLVGGREDCFKQIATMKMSHFETNYIIGLFVGEKGSRNI